MAHEDMPVVAAKVPTRQVVHASAPIWLLTVPAEQLAHSLEL